MNNNNKKIIIFGGSGFLGSHVADELSSIGYHVVIYDNKKSPYLKNEQEMVIGDIMNKKTVQNVTQDAYAVYNFAAIADLNEASENPYKTIEFNTLGNIQILDACVKNKIKRFVFASSVYVYSDAGSFYRISKLASELMIDAYQKKYELNYTIVRYGSLYGPRADLRNGIYRFIHQAINEGKISYHGTKQDKREYIHVTEAARLSAEILDDKYSNEHITLTGQQILTSLELLTMIKEMLNNNKEHKEIEYEIHPPKSFMHYSVTPYNFSPKLGRKLVSNNFVDIGEGIMRVMEEVYKDKHQINNDNESAPLF